MYRIGPIETIIILGVVFLLLALLIVGIIVAITVTQKEKKKHIRVTAEAQKIDAIAAAGRISAEETRELKQALGPIAFTPTSREPDIHIKVIGILNIVFGCLSILLGGGLFFLLVLKLGAVVLLPALLILAVFVLRIIGGFCLMKGAPWARIVIIIFAILGILSFPLGTALSIYTLWALLLREDAGLYFISDNMKAHKVAASILFLIGLPLWVGLVYLTKILPNRVHYWQETDKKLPAITQFVIEIGHICQRFGIIIFLLLFLLTLGSVVWYIYASIKDKNQIQSSL